MDIDEQERKSAFKWLCSAHFLNDVYTGVLNPIMPFIAAKLAISMVISTMIVSISHVFASLIQPLFGFWADNISKRLFVFWGLILVSFFISLAPAAPNPYILTVFVVFGSLGSSLFHPQALGFAPKLAGRDIGRDMGIFMAAGGLGFAFGPIFSSYITQFWGLEKMPFMAVMGLTCAFLMFKFLPKIKPPQTEKPHIDFKKAFRDILTNRKLNILNLIAMLKSFITSSCTILLPFLWKDMGFSPFKIGIVIFLFLLAGSAGIFVSRLVETKIGTPTVFYISMISTLPMMVLFALTYKTIPELSFGIFVAIGFLTSLANPVTMVLAQNVIPEYKSIVAGFINGFSWGVMAVFISAASFVAQQVGIVKVLVVISVFPAICSVLVKKLFTEKA
jgi:FSR family fosmidomycin resistance protein-like MFS transporter